MMYNCCHWPKGRLFFIYFIHTDCSLFLRFCSAQVMLIRVVEYLATGSNGEFEVASVQQAYCRLIAKNGALDIAYAGGAPRRRSSSIGAVDTPSKNADSPSPLWEEDDEGDVFDDDQVRLCCLRIFIYQVIR